jgi:acyl-homoserine-lactone acylase
MARAGSVGVVASLALLAACARGPEEGDEARSYAARVRWTSFGVPHIEAADSGSAAFGLGYAFARDHACILFEQIVKVRGERARWFGPGPDGRYVDSDAGWRALGVAQTAVDVWPQVSERGQAALAGYAAGVNRWVEEHGAAEPCVGAGWVRRLEAVDILAHALGIALDGSGAVFVEDVGRATPPSDGARRPAPAFPGSLAKLRHPRMGSNGWAIGRDRSASGGGMVMSNTHFPSVGEKQWFEAHVRVDGESDVYGAALMGVPVLNLGFNERVAWTHTVSYAPRFVGYLLSLDPEDPTRYRFEDGSGDGYRAMTPTTHRVEVLQGDGSVEVVERTTWASHYGPVIDAPGLGWTPSVAVTFRDANALDLGLFDVWDQMGTATSVDEIIAAHTATQGDPWVYTLAADASGEVWFGDTSRVPNLSEATLASWAALVESPSLFGFVASQFAAYGAIALDGSDPSHAWVEDPRAVEPGLVPLELAPTARRTDYVFNANDSHWLTNVEAPLEGYTQALYGAERTPRSARTRMNGRFLAETGPGSASGDDGRFTLEELEAAMLSMRSSLSEIALPAVVARCAGRGAIALGPGREVDVSAACAALAGWSGRYTADAVGAVVWRSFLLSDELDASDLNAGGGGLFSSPFDPEDPLGTPSQVTSAPPADPSASREPDRVLRALAAAVEALDAAGVAVDATLGETQHMDFEDGARVGVPGGRYDEGTIGVAEWWEDGTTTALPRALRPEALDASGLTADGWWVNDGNSFMLAVELGPDGPRARAVMTYGQSDDPSSPHLHDQATIYAGGALRGVAWTEDQIASDVVEEVEASSP